MKHDMGVYEETAVLFRGLSLALEHGKSLASALKAVDSADYRFLRRQVERLQGMLEVGAPMGEAWEEFAARSEDAFLKSCLMLFSGLSTVEAHMAQVCRRLVTSIEARRDLLYQKDVDTAPVRMQVLIGTSIPVFFFLWLLFFQRAPLLASLSIAIGRQLAGASVGLYACGGALFVLFMRRALKDKRIRLYEELCHGLLVMRLFLLSGFDLRYVVHKVSCGEAFPFHNVAAAIEKRLSYGEEFCLVLSEELALRGDIEWRGFVRQLSHYYVKGYPLADLMATYEQHYQQKASLEGKKIVAKLPYKVIPILLLFYTPATMLLVMIPLAGQVPWAAILG